MPNWFASSRARFAQFHNDALAILDNIARTFQAAGLQQNDEESKTWGDWKGDLA